MSGPFFARLLLIWHAISWMFCMIIGNARASCPDPEQAMTAAQPARVTAARVNFVKDVDPCPDASARCRARAYLMAGDVVLLTERRGAFACATFTGPAGVTTTGWLPTNRLDPLPQQNKTDWPGRWMTQDQQITITPAGGGRLSIKGTATYGGHDPARVARGAVNIGEIEAVTTPSGSHLGFTMGNDRTLTFDQGSDLDCRLRLDLRGPYLVAADNNHCGGMNVTFSGAYRRAP